MKQTQMLCFALFLLCFQTSIAYKNYTVGDSLGWFGNLDYSKWVSSYTFSLGDFLLFNTDSNHTVIQTNSLATYTSCDSQGDNTIQWSSIDPNSTLVVPVTVAVPLLKEGPTYFFSGDYDGEQCMHGQKLAINVVHGQGLPPSLLRDNPNFAVGPTAPGPANPDAGDDTPDVVSSNYDFSHPKNVPSENDGTGDDGDGNDKKKNNGASFVRTRGMLWAGFISGVLSLFI